MSLPVISHNTPGGGSISWTAFGISFNGLTYGIPADNSNKKFIWWVYNNGAPYLAESDTFPTLEEEDLLLFLNKAGIGLLVPMADVMDGSLVVPGSIYAAAIAADQIQTYHINANAVTATEIAANSITATQIMANAIGAEEIGANAIYSNHVTAGAITVDKLTAGSVGADLVANGSFEDYNAGGSLIGWEVIATTNGTVAIVTGVSSSGANALRLAATTTAANLRLRQSPDKFIPVSSASGRKWHISARMGAGTATTVGTYLRANWFDAAKALISTSDALSNSAITTTFSVYEGQVTPPSTAKYMGLEVILTNPNVTTNLYVDEVAAREVIVSAVIGDGAITTPKILAGAVVADKVAARSIGADKLIVADLTNFWQNSDFEADAAASAPAGIVTNANCRVKDISAWAGPVSPAVVNGTTAGNGSLRALEVDALNGSNNLVYDAKVYPVTPGDRFYIYYEGRHLNTTGTGTTALGFRTYNSAKTGVSWSSTMESGSTSFGATKVTLMTPKEGVFVIPAGIYFIQPYVSFDNNAETTNRFIVDNIEIRRMNGGELIVDGAITALKIQTNSVTTNHMAAGSIDAVVLSAKTVTTDKLVISSSDNLLLEADFNNNGVSWEVSPAKAYITINPTGGRGTLPCMRITGSVAQQTSINLKNKFPIGTEDRFRGSMWVKSTAALAAGGVMLRIRAYTDATTYSIKTVATSATLVANTWTNVSGISPILPAGTIAVEAYIAVTNTATGTITDIDYVSLTRAADGNLVVDGTITAPKLEANLILASTIIAGDIAGTHAEMSPSGFRVFAEDAADGIPNEVIRLGVASTNDFFAVTKADGTLATTISQDGVISGDKLYADTELWYKGSEIQTLLDKAPRGIVAWGVINQDIGFTTSEYGMFDVSFLADATRAYRVTVKTTTYTSTAEGVKWRVRSAVTSRPTISSYLQRDNENVGSATQWLSDSFSFVSYPSYQSTGTWTERYLLTAQKMGTGTGTFKNGEVIIEDIGPRIWAAAGINNGGGSAGAAPQQYTTQYQSNNSRSYTGANADYPFNTDKMFQGLSPSGYGNLKSIALFPDMTADLSGATISSMKVLFYFDHWYNNAGGTAYIGVHGHTSIPGTFSDGGNIITSTGWPKPGARWLNIPSNWWSAFASGSARGVSLVGDSTYNSYGYAGRPIIEITYSK